jgi:predicted amidohydrolase
LAWETLNRARAIENQAYVFALNRTGEDGNNLKYQESSHCFFWMELMFLLKVEI